MSAQMPDTLGTLVVLSANTPEVALRRAGMVAALQALAPTVMDFVAMTSVTAVVGIHYRVTVETGQTGTITSLRKPARLLLTGPVIRPS